MAGLILLIASSWAIYNSTLTNEKAWEWASKYIPENEGDFQDWKPFINTDANFEIKFPGIPQVNVEKPDSSMLVLEHMSYTYSPDMDNESNIEYCITYRTFPGQLIRKIDYDREQTNKFLELFIFNMINDEKGSLVSNNDIQYGLYPGKEYIIEKAKGMREIKSRVYLIDNTVYQMMVSSPQGKLDEKTKNYYLNSFKLLSYAQLNSIN